MCQSLVYQTLNKKNWKSSDQIYEELKQKQKNFTLSKETIRLNCKKLAEHHAKEVTRKILIIQKRRPTPTYVYKRI